MTLTPFFSLSPLKTRAYTYNAAQPDAPYAYADLLSYGGTTSWIAPYNLESQYNNDEIILGLNPVDPTEQTISDLNNDVYRRCVLSISFRGVNVSTENQFLLLFSLRSLGGNPAAQFFVGTELLRVEELSGEEQVAILMDVPGDEVWIRFYVRLASTSIVSRLGFMGVDCYLL